MSNQDLLQIADQLNSIRENSWGLLNYSKEKTIEQITELEEKIRINVYNHD